MNAVEEPLQDPSGQDLHPGVTLRRAREACELSQQELAARLRLELRIITAIDNGQFERLPTAAYVKGYLRAYAREVGLDPAPILQAYHRLEDKAPELEPEVSRPLPELTGSDRVVRAASYLVVTVLVLLTALWVKDHLGEIREFFLHQEQVVEPAEEGGPQEPLLPEAGPLPEAIPPAAELPAYQRLENEVVYYPAAAGEGATDRPAPDEATTGEIPEPQTAEASTEVLAQAPPEPLEETGAGAPAESPAAHAPELTLELADKSWIEISDADGKRLYYNLGRPGDTIHVSGTPPYTILIGNSGKVTARVDDQPLDLSPYSIDGVARLILRADGSAVENR